MTRNQYLLIDKYRYHLWFLLIINKAIEEATERLKDSVPGEI